MTNNRLILENKLKDPYNFEDILIEKDYILNEIKELDLSRITFIEPYSMVSLLLLGRNYLRSKGEKLKLINIPINIHQYLTRMDFLKIGIFELEKKLDEKYLLKRSSFSKRVIEVIEIPGKERESVKAITEIIALFRRRASFILKHWISDKIIDYFVTVIAELCQNIFEHSLDTGYISMQTYSMGRENIVRLVISDSGIGIPRSFEKNTITSGETSAKIIEMAVMTPISSKREFGFGLCQVNTIMQKLCGSFFIRSDNSSVTVIYSKKTKAPTIFLKNDLEVFSGTQISISLSS